MDGFLGSKRSTYTQVNTVTFLGWRQLGTETIFFSRQMWSPKSVKFTSQKNTKCKIFQDILVARVRFHMLKYCAAYSLFEMEFSSINRSLSLETEHTKPSQGPRTKQAATLLKRKAHFCHSMVPTVWLAVETAENMAALNVDYSACIITVLSDLTFIFCLNYFPWKLKTSKTQWVSFLLESKHKVFGFKTKIIPLVPVHDAKRQLSSNSGRQH